MKRWLVCQANRAARAKTALVAQYLGQPRVSSRSGGRAGSSGTSAIRGAISRGNMKQKPPTCPRMTMSG